jgi:hypothetical protein
MQRWNRFEIHQGKYLPEVSQFVARIYYDSSHMQFDGGYEHLLRRMQAEDEHWADRTTLVCSYDEEGRLCATARLIRRANGERLPFEREFGIDLDLFGASFSGIYEFARLASDRRYRVGGIGDFFAQMYRQVALDPSDSLVVAGLDRTVHGMLTRRGWPIFDLGFGRDYLGSMTMPVGVGLHQLSALRGGEVCAEEAARHRPEGFLQTQGPPSPVCAGSDLVGAVPSA